MKTIFGICLFSLIAVVSYAQTAESLKARIQEHYKAIQSDATEEVYSHHRKDFSMFNSKGQLLYEPGFEETYEKMGAELSFPKANVVMRHFSAQIVNNVGVATFYLDGSYGEENGTWRVTAVWIWEEGAWKELHHHESKLKK